MIPFDKLRVFFLLHLARGARLIAYRPARLSLALTMAAFLFPTAPAIAESKENHSMRRYRSGSHPSQQAPAKWFTGSVRIDMLTAALLGFAAPEAP